MSSSKRKGGKTEKEVDDLSDRSTSSINDENSSIGTELSVNSSHSEQEDDGSKKNTILPASPEPKIYAKVRLTVANVRKLGLEEDSEDEDGQGKVYVKFSMGPTFLETTKKPVSGNISWREKFNLRMTTARGTILFYVFNGDKLVGVAHCSLGEIDAGVSEKIKLELRKKAETSGALYIKVHKTLVDGKVESTVDSPKKSPSKMSSPRKDQKEKKEKEGDDNGVEKEKEEINVASPKKEKSKRRKKKGDVEMKNEKVKEEEEEKEETKENEDNKEASVVSPKKDKKKGGNGKPSSPRKGKPSSPRREKTKRGKDKKEQEGEEEKVAPASSPRRTKSKKHKKASADAVVSPKKENEHTVETPKKSKSKQSKDQKDGTVEEKVHKPSSPRHNKVKRRLSDEGQRSRENHRSPRRKMRRSETTNENSRKNGEQTPEEIRRVLSERRKKNQKKTKESKKTHIPKKHKEENAKSTKSENSMIATLVNDEEEKVDDDEYQKEFDAEQAKFEEEIRQQLQAAKLKDEERQKEEEEARTRAEEQRRKEKEAQAQAEEEEEAKVKEEEDAEDAEDAEQEALSKMETESVSESSTESESESTSSEEKGSPPVVEESTTTLTLDPPVPEHEEKENKSETLALPADMVTSTVLFKISYNTNWGETVVVCGSHPIIGKWEFADALELQWTKGGVWSLEVPLISPKDKLVEFEYKFAIRDNDGLLKFYEGGANREMKFSPGAKINCVGFWQP